MTFTRKDINKINKILKDFPDIEDFNIEETESNGIGSIITLSFITKLNNNTGIFKIELSGIEDW